jgi:hypothetical protein
MLDIMLIKTICRRCRFGTRSRGNRRAPMGGLEMSKEFQNWRFQCERCGHRVGSVVMVDAKQWP